MKEEFQAKCNPPLSIYVLCYHIAQVYNLSTDIYSFLPNVYKGMPVIAAILTQSQFFVPFEYISEYDYRVDLLKNLMVGTEALEDFNDTLNQFLIFF